MEPSHNAAELVIQPWVLWYKGSFGKHSPPGYHFAEARITVAVTLKQQQYHVLS
jgi:hypothetical protein